MSHCGNCSGDCAACSGCKGALVLTEGEIRMLLRLAQIPFLPIARKTDGEEPVYLEETGEEYGKILLCLEKKDLISLDYDKPLRGFSYEAYTGFPVRGSMALTARGQVVVELLERQGADD